jgi:pyruvate dehydrogenase E2 component (dihydrolipoamide acetyltransferase)
VRLSVSQISAERNRLVECVRSRAINEDDTGGGTFTLTNLGMYPVDRFEALLSPPQAAILSIGRIHQMAFPVGEGGVGFQPVIEFGLTLDHRVVDGAAGAAFVKDFLNRIETITPEGA